MSADWMCGLGGCMHFRNTLQMSYLGLDIWGPYVFVLEVYVVCLLGV